MQPVGTEQQPVAVAPTQGLDESRGYPALTRVGRIWMSVAVAFSALLVLTTAANTFYGPGGIPGRVLSSLDLRFEQNVAATWSGLLLAMASVHAFDGYTRDRLHNRSAARGWILIALLLAALSLDEIGSVHERLGVLANHLGINVWLPVLPYGLILAAMGAYSLVLLWRTRKYRRYVAYILLGFVVLTSVAGQEFIEHSVTWTSAAARAFRASLEEGTELVGMLILFQVTARNTAGLAGTRAPGYPTFEVVRALRRPLAWAAFVLAPFFAYLSAVVADRRGRPADWAAELLLLAAILATVRIPLAKGGGMAWYRWAICGLLSLAIIVVCEGAPLHEVNVGIAGADVRLLSLGGIAFLVCVGWCFDPAVRSGPFFLIGACMFGLLAAISLPWIGAFAVYWLSQLVALAFYLIALAATRQAEGAALGTPVRSSA